MVWSLKDLDKVGQAMEKIRQKRYAQELKAEGCAMIIAQKESNPHAIVPSRFHSVTETVGVVVFMKTFVSPCQTITPTKKQGSSVTRKKTIICSLWSNVYGPFLTVAVARSILLKRRKIKKPDLE